MMPASDRLEVVSQRRDREQHELTIDYVTRTQFPRSAWWLCSLEAAGMFGLLFQNRARLRL